MRCVQLFKINVHGVNERCATTDSVDANSHIVRRARDKHKSRLLNINYRKTVLRGYPCYLVVIMENNNKTFIYDIDTI